VLITNPPLPEFVLYLTKVLYLCAAFIRHKLNYTKFDALVEIVVSSPSKCSKKLRLLWSLDVDVNRP
jgi:hypothetical protein